MFVFGNDEKGIFMREVITLFEGLSRWPLVQKEEARRRIALLLEGRL
jgi:hypothetical protein